MYCQEKWEVWAGLFDIPVVSLVPVRRLRRRQKKRRVLAWRRGARPAPFFFSLEWGGLAARGKKENKKDRYIENLWEVWDAGASL
jgi:hypothetical protein